MSLYVILTQSKANDQEVYRTVCYGPFESPQEALEFGREFLDEAMTVVELLAPQITAIDPLVDPKLAERQLPSCEPDSAPVRPPFRSSVS